MSSLSFSQIYELATWLTSQPVPPEFNQGFRLPKRVPVTAGAGNGQGRKPTWKSGKTKAIRVPEVFADRLINLAKEWDEHYV